MSLIPWTKKNVPNTNPCANYQVVMLKDSEFDDDDYKPDELQNDSVVMLKGS